MSNILARWQDRIEEITRVATEHMAENNNDAALIFEDFSMVSVDMHGAKRVGYSIGMSMTPGMREVIVFGPNGDNTHKILAFFKEWMDEHKCIPEDGTVFTDIGSVPMQVKYVTLHQVFDFVEPVIETMKKHSVIPSFFQVVVGDRHGRLPDDPHFEREYMTGHYGQIEPWKIHTGLH